MFKTRSTTPCLGICSTTYGDDVCKGCKRFVHEVINWNKYSSSEKEVVNSRLEEFKVLILKERFLIEDPDAFKLKLNENAINFNNALDPLTWVFDLLRAAGSQHLDLSQFGIKVLAEYDPGKIKDEINDELLNLSEAHHQRYFKKL
ncbi:DUF1289 domain-containing protein [Gammaproteobacteria bacterium]|jgi:predicted Fe-S protein YdhL (DUF1289 family)|nr:DUF1289 domain-containing protein [Gammaproteobacteria bacterium]MDC3248360.1 DUF1289 domain-containing protein [Gammaproteobacteria bacterium]